MLGRARTLALPLVVLSLLSWLPARPHAQPKPLEIGVVPHLSAGVLMSNYQPLRKYLERELRRPVQISTAPDFKTFFQRTQGGEYDMAVTAAHLARVAQLDAKYAPILVFHPPITGIIITAKDGPMSSSQDLRSKSLAVPNPNSLVVMRGLQWLAERDLHRDRDFQLMRTPTQDSVADLVINGDSIAAMLSDGELRAIPEGLRARLRVLVAFAEIPNFVVLINPGMASLDAAALKASLLRFAEPSEEGKAFFGAIGIQGMRPVGEADLRALDPFLDQTRRMMGSSQ